MGSIFYLFSVLCTLKNYSLFLFLDALRQALNDCVCHHLCLVFLDVTLFLWFPLESIVLTQTPIYSSVIAVEV